MCIGTFFSFAREKNLVLPQIFSIIITLSFVRFAFFNLHLLLAVSAQIKKKPLTLTHNVLGDLGYWGRKSFFQHSNSLLKILSQHLCGMMIHIQYLSSNYICVRVCKQKIIYMHVYVFGGEGGSLIYLFFFSGLTSKFVKNLGLCSAHPWRFFHLQLRGDRVSTI